MHNCTIHFILAATWHQPDLVKVSLPPEYLYGRLSEHLHDRLCPARVDLHAANPS